MFISLAALFAELLSANLHLCCGSFGFIGLFYVKNLEFSMHTKHETIAGQYSDVGSIVSSRSYYCWSPPRVLTAVSLLQFAAQKRSQIYCLWSVSVNQVVKPTDGLGSGQGVGSLSTRSANLVSKPSLSRNYSLKLRSQQV